MTPFRPSDAEVRARAFNFLKLLREAHGPSLPRAALVQGFELEGHRVPLMGPQGIFKPAVLDAIPLSITTVPLVEGKARPYEDELRADGFINYRYRAADSRYAVHPENIGLRLAMANRVPLIYFFGLLPGWYAAEFPAFIVGDDASRQCFTVAVDDQRLLVTGSAGDIREEGVAVRRQYITRTTQQRLHQESFRKRVLRAYESCCAVCRLKHENLLEAAHILSDKHPKGEPFVTNGLALCKLHHAAFDANILGIRPDCIVEIREDILREKDGPMLTHGLQALNGHRLMKLPHALSKRPSPENLEIRYAEFREAG